MPPRIPSKCLKPPRLQLLGASDCENPSAISKEANNQTALDSSVDSMDCHADKSARNDEKNSLCEKVDSRSEAQNPNNPTQDSSEVPFLSLRENPQGFSWQSISAQADSKQNAQNLSKPQAEAKVDSSTATTLSQPAKDSRSFDKEAQNVSEPQAEAKVDSSNDYSASAECVDCHADKSARNDEKNSLCEKVDSRSEAQNLNNSAQDSRSFNKNAQILHEPQAAGFAMRKQGAAAVSLVNRGFSSACKGAYLAYVTAARAQKSTIYRAKPTPKTSKAESSNNAENVFYSHATRRQDFEARIVALQGESRELPKAVMTAGSPQQSAILAQKPTPRLAFVSNTCFGMYNFRLQVLKSLQQSGFAIHIIAPFDESTRSLEQAGFSTHNLYLDSRSLNPLKDFRTTYALYKLLKHIHPALVFSYTIKPAIYSSSVCNLLKIPNIAVITGLGYVFINDKDTKSSLKKRVLRFIVCLMYRSALKATQEVWFLNNDDKQEFLAYKLIKQNQAFLLDSEGVDTEYFSPKSSGVKAEKQGEQGEIVFLLVARMLWDKGVGEFVEAAKMLQESIKKANKIESNGGINKPLPTPALTIRFQLLGASDCKNPSAISKGQILAWEKQGIIEYLGSTSDVRPFVESASCVVLPSYREGVSVSLLEAMSMGKPIITSRASGCKHLVKEFDNGCSNGFLCEVRDAKSLANAMREFIALDSTTRETMGQNARELARKSYDVGRIIAHYHRATKEHPPKARIQSS